MKGVFLDFDTMYAENLDASVLENALDDFTFYGRSEPSEIVKRAQGANILLTNKCKITGDIIRALPDLKLIIVTATGYDNIDVEAARAQGVMVCNVVGYSTPSVAQHVFTLLLGLVSNLTSYAQDVREGKWQRSRDFCFIDYPMRELSGKVLGLIGYGDIAKEVETIAKAFGMEVMIAERRGTETIREGRHDFYDVLKRSDVLSFHCPLNAATRDLITEKEISVMKDDVILINTSRGGIINEADLAQALENGSIGGAGIDVLSKEPPTEDNPLLAKSYHNLIITPHIAWASVEARLRMFEDLARIIKAYQNGNPVNVLT